MGVRLSVYVSWRGSPDRPTVYLGGIIGRRGLNSDNQIAAEFGSGAAGKVFQQHLKQFNALDPVEVGTTRAPRFRRFAALS